MEMLRLKGKSILKLGLMDGEYLMLKDMKHRKL